MEAAALAAARWVISPIIKWLINESVTYLGSDVKKGLEDLEIKILPQFDLVIEAAKKSQHKDKLEKWLNRLKEAYYDAEDILDELEYDRLRHQVKRKGRNITVRVPSHPIIRPFKKLPKQIHRKLSLLSPKKMKLWRQLNKLKEIASEAKTFRDLLGIHPGNEVVVNANDPTITSSLLSTHDMIGRDKEREQIIHVLLNDQAESSSVKRCPVVAITGVPGEGKTTLAKHIYNDQRVIDHFGCRMWVCLSRKLDIIEHTKEMIESITRKSPKFKNFDTMQNELKEIFESKNKILLVLDDVWYNKNAGDEEWDKLLDPINSSAGKCMILVTSRLNSFPVGLLPGNHIPLESMETNVFLSLFQYYAFQGFKIECSEQRKEFDAISIEIAEKLNKSPLVAKAVGNRLCKSVNIKIWQDTAKNVDLHDKSGFLLWSYEHLHVELQRCFLMCSIYPKGARIFGDDIIPLWVAANLIKPVDDNRTVETIGESYCEELLACGVFQLMSDYSGRLAYKMHDNFHDLAERLSKNDCFRIESNEVKEIPCSVRHLSIRAKTLREHLPNICKLVHLQTLIIHRPIKEDVNEILTILGSKLKRLRILTICFHDSLKLTKLVGGFKHLRLLCVRRTQINELPSSVLKLYHLQYLRLNTSIPKCPKKLSHLRKLRAISVHARNSTFVRDCPPIRNVGNLNSLQYLETFYVWNGDEYNIQQLQYLRELKGNLSILNLDMVRSKEEAIKANLHEKRGLEGLELVWKSPEENNEGRTDLEVIEGLRPPPSLKKLIIDGYAGTGVPNWLSQDAQVHKIETLKLRRCRALQAIPEMVSLSQSCNELVLSDLLALRKLSLPKSLTHLEMVLCPLLLVASEEERHGTSQINGGKEYEHTISLLQQNLQFFKNKTRKSYVLRRIFSHECSIFRQINLSSNNSCAEEYLMVERASDGVSFNTDLDVIKAWWSCHLQRIDFMQSQLGVVHQLIIPSTLSSMSLKYCNITNGGLSDCLRNLSSLQELKLQGLMALTEFAPGMFKELTRLKNLVITYCWNLRSLGVIQELNSLEVLNIKMCPCLNTEGNNGKSPLPRALQTLFMIHVPVPDNILDGDFPFLNHIVFASTQTLPSLCIGQLPSIRELQLYNCPELFSLDSSQKLPFLQRLRLTHVPKLKIESICSNFTGCQSIRISDCNTLQLLMTSEQKFDAPITLHVDECEDVHSMLNSIINYVPSLEVLGFFRCDFESVPSTIKNLTSLKKVKFDGCHGLSSLPEMPKSLTHIIIEDCPVLKESCKPTGVNWSKIKDIRWKDFD